MPNAGTGGQMVTPPDQTTTDPYAVIAELRQQLAHRSVECDGALAREATLAEVHAVINRSPGDPGPVFHMILHKAHSSVRCDNRQPQTHDGTYLRTVAAHGYPPDHPANTGLPFPASRSQQSAVDRWRTPGPLR